MLLGNGVCPPVMAMAVRALVGADFLDAGADSSAYMLTKRNSVNVTPEPTLLGAAEESVSDPGAAALAQAGIRVQDGCAGSALG